ncbi:MAG: GNAT family N-acetyltransferase [Candidatus Cryosericum sp.]
MLDSGSLTVQRLSTKQLEQVRQLAALCEERDGVSMDARLDFGALESGPADSSSCVLRYANGVLVGFAGMYSWGEITHVELVILVHPQFRRQGIGRGLLHTVLLLCRKRGVTQLLLVVPRELPGSAVFARQAGTRHAHAEYTLDLDASKIPAGVSNAHPVELRRAGTDDIPVMAAIAGAAFKVPFEEEQESLARLMRDSARTTWLGALDGLPVGVVQSADDDGRIFIVHFAVRPEMQGKGIGRQMLLAIIRGLLDTGQQRITIEVETENEHALGLYESCGFVSVNVTDYELVELDTGPTAPGLLFGN